MLTKEQAAARKQWEAACKEIDGIAMQMHPYIERFARGELAVTSYLGALRFKLHAAVNARDAAFQLFCILTPGT